MTGTTFLSRLSSDGTRRDLLMSSDGSSSVATRLDLLAPRSGQDQTRRAFFVTDTVDVSTAIRTVAARTTDGTISGTQRVIEITGASTTPPISRTDAAFLKARLLFLFEGQLRISEGTATRLGDQVNGIGCRPAVGRSNASVFGFETRRSRTKQRCVSVVRQRCVSRWHKPCSLSGRPCHGLSRKEALGHDHQLVSAMPHCDTHTLEIA